MWALGLIQTDGGGLPKIDTSATPYCGHIFIGEVAGWGAYLISGTGPQLTAINALPQAVGICVMTQDENVKWMELDSVIVLAIRQKLNTWLSAHNYSTIPAGWTNKQVVLAIFRKLNDRFDLDKEWVKDS